MVSCIRLIFVLCLICFALLPAEAAMSGTVVAIQTTAQWGAGNLALISIPSLQKKTLVTGSCTGPCLSPDRNRVAFIMNNKIQYVNSDGSSTAPVNTGITVTITNGPEDQGEGAVALYWLSLNSSVGTGEYFYWVTINDGGGWFRAKVGTTTVEKLVSGLYWWGGVSQDGTHASGVADYWRVVKMDLVAKTVTSVTADMGGCNTSVSPDGKYILHNLNTGTWDPSYKHTHSMIRNWTTGARAGELLQADCNFDNHRWSHFDTAVVMWRNFNQYGACPAQYQSTFGVVYNIVTQERINIGQYVGYDYFPGPVGTFETATDEPVFNPPSGILPGGTGTIALTSTSAGASIRYTTDGTTPSTTAGTLLPAGGTFNLAIPQGQSVTVRAIAYKSGLTSSVITSALYRAPDSIPVFTISSPKAGDLFQIGDTLPITWTHRAGTSYSAMGISISVNNGRLFMEGVLTASITPNDPGWENYHWVIPDSLNGTSLISTAVKIRVDVYGNEGINAISESFTIAAVAPRSLKMNGTLVTSVTSPTGQGNKNIEVIRDNVYPTSGSFDVTYDTYDDAVHDADYFGYTFTSLYSFTGITYKYGLTENVNDGSFKTMSVQVLSNGVWTTIPNVTCTPAYLNTTVTSFSSYVFTLPMVQGSGIRIIGQPSDGYWVTCSELDVYGTISSGVTGSLAGPGEKNRISGREKIKARRISPGTMQFSFASPVPQFVSVFSSNGNLIRIIRSQSSTADVNGSIADWDLKNQSGRTMCPGIYFVMVSLHGKKYTAVFSLMQ